MVSKPGLGSRLCAADIMSSSNNRDPRDSRLPPSYPSLSDTHVHTQCQIPWDLLQTVSKSSLYLAVPPYSPVLLKKSS